MSIQKSLAAAVKFLLFFAAFTPLIFTPFSLYPFVFSKAVFFRVIIEIALVFFLFSALFTYKKLPVKNPLFVFIALFVLSAAVSLLLAPNSYRGFFGDIERGEGFYGLLHYFVFFLMALLVFDKKDWLRFFKISLIVGFIVVFYGWLQFLGVNKFPPFGLGASSQPGSLTGNSAFFASYLVLLLGLAAVVGREAQNKSWKYFSVFLSLIILLTVFITAIRGAILGLAAGAFFLLLYLSIFSRYAALGFAGFPKLNLKKISIVLLALLVGFGLTFWFTRSADVWQSIPGLKRFARASFDIPSVATRIMSLGVSWEAFQEKPILGWGMENYNIAYNKHYNPKYALYAEDWFDRAHNKVAEIGVTQGLVGLIIYFGIFVSIFYLLFKKNSSLRKLAPLLTAILVAYFIQNLFIFDQLLSYIPIFAIFGFIVFASTPTQQFDNNKLSPHYNPIGIITAVILTAGVLYSLSVWNYIPYSQSVQFMKAYKIRVGEKLLAASDKLLYPYNFAQSHIRTQFLEMIYNAELIPREEFRPLTERALSALEEVVKKEPFEPRRYLGLIESYNVLAKKDPAYFKKSETAARAAFALSPKRQAILYHLAFALAGQERYEEAIKLAQETIALEPGAAKSYYHLAIALALSADSFQNKNTSRQEFYRVEAEKVLDKAFELGGLTLGTLQPYPGTALSNTQFYLFMESDFKNMIILYRSWGQYEKVLKVLEAALNAQIFPNNKDFLYDALTIARTLRLKEWVIKYAQRLKNLDPKLSDDMEVIIDLAQKEKWEILDSL